MPRFKIEWTEEVWYESFVEADDESQALDKFLLDGVPDDTAAVGSCIADSIEVSEA